MEFAREPNRTDLLADRADTTPEATALIRTTDGEQWSYRALDYEVDRTAGKLATMGIGEGDRVGLLMGNRVEFLRVLYATFRLGATAVPYNRNLAVETLSTQISRSDPDLLVCADSTVSLTEHIAGDRPSVSVDPVDNARTLDAIEEAPIDPPSVTAATDRLLLYTSGTTGDPKGVRLTAGNLRSSAIASALRLGIDPEDRWLAPLPAYHMGGLAPHLRSTLYGTTAVLQPSFDADRTRSAIAEFDVTCVSLVPTAAMRLLDAGAVPESLRFVLCGGAPTPQPLVDRCERRDVPLCPTYGMTETASQVATALPETAREHEGTVGPPLQGTSVWVLAKDGDPLPAGEEGELVVDGPTVTPGYDGNSEGDPFDEYGFHTGDLGYRDESGRLWVTGRVDDLIITGGENVNPHRVAKAIESLDTIEAAAVVGLDDPEWGERVGTMLVPAADADAVAGAELADSLRERLASYERPKTATITSQLPRTESGTVDREAVRERLETAGLPLGELGTEAE